MLFESIKNILALTFTPRGWKQAQKQCCVSAPLSRWPWCLTEQNSSHLLFHLLHQTESRPANGLCVFLWMFSNPLTQRANKSVFDLLSLSAFSA